MVVMVTMFISGAIVLAEMPNPDADALWKYITPERAFIF